MADIEVRRECPFCQAARPILETELAYAIYDLSPVTPGHMLLIPRRHIADWFDTTLGERQALLDLAQQAHDLLRRERQPDGFNLGVNVGEAAGQTVGHVHLHLIPRYRGDVENPRGGVRGVIPARQSY
jgi:diadenosine tetraphosphate (Ap4A) HIT family hydrolase